MTKSKNGNAAKPKVADTKKKVVAPVKTGKKKSKK